MVEKQLRTVEFAPGFVIDMPADIVREQVEGQIAPSFSRKAYDGISIILSVHSGVEGDTALGQVEVWKAEAGSWRSWRWEAGFTGAPLRAPNSASTLGVDSDGNQLACLVLAWPTVLVRAVLILPGGNMWKDSWAFAALHTIRRKPS